jgi:hypothetical protein
MIFEISSELWDAVRKFFSINPAEKKFIPSEQVIFYFRKMDDGQIFAFPKQEHMEKFILGAGNYATAVRVQNEEGDIFCCKIISKPEYVKSSQQQATRPQKSFLPSFSQSETGCHNTVPAQVDTRANTTCVKP